MMPAIFIGHGTPMNAIEQNEFTDGWKEIAASFAKPKAILSISAHWVTDGTKILSSVKPRTIHDFYGFPQKLYNIEFPANGSPELAKKTLNLLNSIATLDNTWGLDHGTWSVLHVMYPDADIPVYQLSLDYYATPEQMFDIGNKLQALRDDDVLILGSGNIVHNLTRVEFDNINGFDWALKFDNYILNCVLQKDYAGILNYKSLGNIANLAVPTNEHFSPLLYILGSINKDENVTVYNQKCFGGSISMTSFVFK